MARSRMLRPEFFNDPEFNRLSIGARYLFQALLIHMDRHGVFWGQPQIVRSIVFPCDAKMRWADVARWLDELHQIGRIRLFTYNDTIYLIDLRFGLHQRVYAEDPDTYKIPLETRSKVAEDWIEIQRQQSLPLLNLNQNLNLNRESDKNSPVDNSNDAQDKSGHQGESDDASLMPNALNKKELKPTVTLEMTKQEIEERRHFLRSVGKTLDDVETARLHEVVIEKQNETNRLRAFQIIQRRKARLNDDGTEKIPGYKPVTPNLSDEELQALLSSVKFPGEVWPAGEDSP